MLLPPAGTLCCSAEPGFDSSTAMDAEDSVSKVEDEELNELFDHNLCRGVRP